MSKNNGQESPSPIDQSEMRRRLATVYRILVEAAFQSRISANQEHFPWTQLAHCSGELNSLEINQSTQLPEASIDR
jgi:hypothetical protein